MSTTLSDGYIKLLAEEGNGAVQAELPDGKPLFAVIVGPIKTWWDRMDSDEYKAYAEWRDAVRVAIIHEGCLVYSPHRAWQGAWHEGAQAVNDLAITQSDVVITLTPPGVEASGTDAEVEVANGSNTPVIAAPPGGEKELLELIAALRVIQANN